MMEKSMISKVSAVAAAALMTVSLAGCAGSTGSTVTSAPPETTPSVTETSAEAEAFASSQTDAKDYEVALLLPGTVNDKGWNQEAYEGLQMIEKETGCQTAYSEKVAATEYENVFRGYADQGFNLIIGHGYQFADAAMKVAPDYPDSMFCITSADVYQEPNVCSLENLNGEQGFLAGVVAAMATKSGVVASVGGLEIPAIVYFNQGFVQGAAYVNPDIKALTALTGNFDDAAKVKEQTNAFIQQGADVITHDANAAGLGIFEAIRETDGIYAIGSIQDQYDLLPEKTLTSATNRISKAILLAAQYQLAGDLEPVSYKFGVKEGVIGLSDFRELKSVFTEEQLTEIEEIKKKISNDEIEVEVSLQ